MIRYEKINLTNRIDLLTKIQSFLSVCGWSCERIDDETLNTTDSKGGSLKFNFISYKNDPNYGYSARSFINAIDENNQSVRVAFIRFNNSQIEFDGGYIIADSEKMCLYLQNLYGGRNLFFTSGYINKSHEFNGGRVAYASIYASYSSGYNWGGYYDNEHGSANKPFSNQTPTLFSLGGAWRNLHNVDLRESKILTNLIDKNTNQSQNSYNQLSALSAVDLLNIRQSNLSGLYTMITPNFFYKNNENIFVHCGSFDFVRVMNESTTPAKRFKNGQILHLGDEKFMTLRPYTESTATGGNFYTLAVKIA